MTLLGGDPMFIEPISRPSVPLLPIVAPFLPEIVRALLDTSQQPMIAPWSLRFEGAVVRVLIDGFSGLCETFADRPDDGERLMSQALESVFGDRVGMVHSFGGSSVLIDGLGMVLLFPAAASEEARFLAGRAALGACLLMRGAGGPGRGRPGARGPSIEVRMGCHLGEVVLGAVGTRGWHVVLAGPGLQQADAAATSAQPGEVMATDGLLGWVGTVRTEGTFHRGMASVTALPPPEDRLEPATAGLRGGSEELARRILAAVPAEVRDWAYAGGGAFHSRFEPAAILHAGLDGLGAEGDPKAVEKLHIVVERAAAIAQELGGQVESVGLEDRQSWMVLGFSSAEGEAGRVHSALHASLELRRALRLPFLGGLRLGLASGTVFRAAIGGEVRRQLGAIGPPVEGATRLSAFAAPGQILVDEDARAQAGDLFEFELETVRTTPAGQKAHQQARRSLSRQVPVLIRSLDPLRRAAVAPPMIGRDVELALCESALLEAGQGRGSALCLRGARGMGKTTLLKEVASRAEGMGLSVLWVVCAPAQSQLDLGPLRSLLARLSDEASEAPAAEEPDARELARRLAAALRGVVEQSPVLIVLEDLHLASPLARSLARKMGSLLASLPVVLLLAEEPPAEATAEEPGPEVIELQPLSAEEAAELCMHLRDGGAPAPEIVATILDRSGGNPFHLAELVRALDTLPPEQQTAEGLAALPSGLPQVVAWRIGRLEPELRRTLELAASLPLPSPLEELRARHPEPALISEVLTKLAARGFALPLSGQDPVRIDFAEPYYAEVLRALPEDVRLASGSP
jgi:class 3 adenylate cyclase